VQAAVGEPVLASPAFISHRWNSYEIPPLWCWKG